MSLATLTLMGLYQHGLRRNKNIFDSLVVPEGIDHDILVNNILHEGGDFEVLYPDLDLMDKCLEFFSAKWRRTFEKWLEVMSIEYEPLENYNRLEAWSDSFSESEENSLSQSLSSSESTSTSASDQTSNSVSVDNDISAFNANTLQNDTSATTAAATAGKSNVLSKHDNFERKDVEAGRDLINLNTHRGRVHGNIGVMTTQAMFKEEWELDKLNIYDEIYILFAKEFLIPFSY